MIAGISLTEIQEITAFKDIRQVGRHEIVDSPQKILRVTLLFCLYFFCCIRFSLGFTLPSNGLR